jgi:hypothetical protein
MAAAFLYAGIAVGVAPATVDRACLYITDSVVWEVVVADTMSVEGAVEVSDSVVWKVAVADEAC